MRYPSENQPRMRPAPDYSAGDVFIRQAAVPMSDSPLPSPQAARLKRDIPDVACCETMMREVVSAKR
jgi:hypothetical protein